ncbi:hypothetical protein LTR36_006510 [Oleoguttula mirabilis]|uniref:Uncharacterized protein n=1 Tax=Oleoguttula mirabilis TaxID=1507867 RepID=A0AAV9JV90_9PEZI|nr:hypothetical protein LTR36_006510 [Oleoguttula mirabilis]
MADRDSKEPPETAASTPSSQHASQTGPRSSKDRNCPFCGQAFTSSSLGRHLDLYIKPKNPKPADGVHHPDEISKMRGGITRRQPKANLKDGANIDASGWRHPSAEGTPNPAPSNSHSHRPAPLPEVLNNTRVTESSGATSPVNMREHDIVHMSFNAANWQATGVINNLPPRAPLRAPSRDKAATSTGQAQRIQEMRRDANGNKVQRPDHDDESKWKLQEAAEVGRAAELALREVLGSLEAAKKRVEPQVLFPEIEFFSLSFPGLCLALLPAPTTIFSPSPFPGCDSWTLAPPGQKQFETLNRFVLHRVNDSSSEEVPDAVIFKHNVHMQGAYEHWKLMPEHDRASAWTLETLRALSRASDERQQVKLELEAAQNRIRHLETEYDRLSRFQLPREYLLHPPNTMPAPAAIIREMQNTQLTSGAAEVDYDVDALLSKWRTAVKATTRRPPPHATQDHHAPIYDESYDRQKRSEDRLGGDIVLNGSVFGVNGAMPRTDGAYMHDPGYVDYETPPNPGVVVGAEEDEEEKDDDADGERDDESGNFGIRGALVKQSRGSRANRTLNANGKRPHAPTATNGRAVGSKVLRERPKGAHG